MGPGRNQLCPCGSGKKFKNCCLRAELAAAETPHETLHRRVRAAIQNLTEDLLRFVDKYPGRECFAEAWAKFSSEEDAAFDPKSPHIPVFIPWFYHQWTPAAESTHFPELASRAATVSGERAARARSLVERLLGTNAEFRVSKPESSESLLERARQSPEPAKRSEHEELMQLPEVREGSSA